MARLTRLPTTTWPALHYPGVLARLAVVTTPVVLLFSFSSELHTLYSLDRVLTLMCGSPNDFKFGNMSSSIESDRGSIHNAISILNREDELVSQRCYLLFGSVLIVSQLTES